MSIVRSLFFASRVRGATPSAGLVVLGVVVLLTVAGQGTAQAAANTALSNRASASGLPVGTPIYDTVTLGGGVNPTGIITFKLFGPGNPTCAGTPIFMTTTPVNGNGYYESKQFTPNTAGTYSWIAVYGGNTANNPSAPTLCSASSAQVTVSKKNLVLTVSRSWVPPSTTATGALSSGAGPNGPTGTITFTLFGPANMTCAGAPAYSTTRTVAGNGSYVSVPFSPTASGTYQWILNYSGDVNNFPRTSTCAETTNGFTVAAVAAPTVSGTPTTVPRGGTVTVNWSGIAKPTAYDWVALYPVGTPNGGTVTVWKFTTGTASGSVALKLPWGAVAGNYEIRLMANNTTQRLATSGPITVVW